MTTESPGTRLTCHHCGSPNLYLTQVVEDNYQWSSGLMLVDGQIHPLGEFELMDHGRRIREEKSKIRCDNCGHEWHPRRPVGEAYELEHPQPVRRAWRQTQHGPALL